jgi:hypothetical protein
VNDHRGYRSHVTTFGLKLMSEIHGPRALVAQAAAAGDDIDGFFSFWDEHVRPALA